MLKHILCVSCHSHLCSKSNYYVLFMRRQCYIARRIVILGIFDIVISSVRKRSCGDCQNTIIADIGTTVPFWWPVGCYGDDHEYRHGKQVHCLRIPLCYLLSIGHPL